MAVKIIFLIVFFLSMALVGVYCRRHATDVNGFVLGGRGVGPWLTAFAYGTSYFSAVIFVGYAGQFGWKFGIASTWIGIGNALLGSLLAWVVLGRRTRVMTQHLNSATMPEFFGIRYGSKALKIAASVIVFVFLIPYTASLYNGLSRLFEMAFHVDYAICVVVMSVLTGIYVVVGGYMATAINDLIQGMIMLFGIVAVVLAVLNGQGGFLLMATAGENHLWEFKNYIYQNPYRNVPRRDMLRGFEMIDVIQLAYQIELQSAEDIQALFSMTPYFWKTSRKDAERLQGLQQMETTAAFDILLYRKLRDF